MQSRGPSIEELRQLVDQLDRPAALGPLGVTIMPPPGLIDADTARRYEELGVDRLVLNHSSEASTGAASDARRRTVLEAIESAAEILAPWLDPAG
jgi:hypothetical protein